MNRLRALWPLAAIVLLASIPARAAAVEDTVELRHGPVRYELSGNPAATRLVVLVAGYSVPMSVWRGVLPALHAADFAVLRFDLYGRGGSARPRVDYTVDLFADQLWELVTHDRLKLHERFAGRFNIVGSSMGGPIAARFVNRHPDVAERLVFVSPAGLGLEPPAVATLLRIPGIGETIFRTAFHALMLDHLRDNVAESIWHYPRIVADLKEQLSVPGTDHAMLSTLRHTLLQNFSADFRAVGHLNIPALSVWGDRDILVPPQTDDVLRRAIPHLVRHRIRDAGHLPQLERPRLFGRRVVPFLRGEPWAPER